MRHRDVVLEGGGSSHQEDGAVVTPTSENVRAIGTEHHAVDPRRMPCKCPVVLTGDRIPNENLLMTPTSDCAPIGTERHAQNPKLMSGEFPVVGTGERIPKVDGPVVTPTSDCATIGTEC